MMCSSSHISINAQRVARVWMPRGKGAARIITANSGGVSTAMASQ